MTSAGPSTDHSTLTPKQLEDSVAEAEKEWELVRGVFVSRWEDS